MKKLMGTAALAAMLIAGQGVSAIAEHSKITHGPIRIIDGIPPVEIGDNPGSVNVRLNSGCGNGGEGADSELDENDNDPGNKPLANQAGDQCPNPEG